MPKPRAVIYIRVSDPSQIENNSLETQEAICRKYAEQNGYEIACEPFRDEGISAKHVNTRPGMVALMSYATAKKNNISFALVYKLDRWSRNTEEGLGAKLFLSKSGVQLLSVTEAVSDDPAGRFIATVLLASGQFDNEVKGVRVTDNMMAMFTSGLWCWGSPIGYKRQLDIDGSQIKKAPRIIHPNIGPIIKNMFEQASTGIYSRAQLAEEMNVRGYEQYRGKPATAKLVGTIIPKTFYYGLLYAPKWQKYAQGIHQPLITEDTYNRANHAIFGKKLKYKYQDSKQYPLKGFVKCDLCGKAMTSSRPKGRTKYYTHYECGKPGCHGARIMTEKAHDQFMDLLAEMKPTERSIKLFHEMVRREWNVTLEDLNNRTKMIDQQITHYNAELDRISKSFDAGIYTQPQATEASKPVQIQLTALKIARSDEKMYQYDIEIVNNFATHFFSNLHQFWLTRDLPKRQALQNAIYPGGIYITKNKYIRTTELAPSFELIRSLSVDKSNLVTLLGFEPKLPG